MGARGVEGEPGSSIAGHGAYAWPTHCSSAGGISNARRVPRSLAKQRGRQSSCVKEELVLVDDWKVAVSATSAISDRGLRILPHSALLNSDPARSFPSPLSRACCHSLDFSLDQCFSNSQLPSFLVHLGIEGEASPTLFLRKEQGTLPIRAQEGQDQEGSNASDISSNNIGPGYIPSHQGRSLDDAHFVLNTAVSILVCFAVFAFFSSLRLSFRTGSLSPTTRRNSSSNCQP
jgi:hypothetical protein